MFGDQDTAFFALLIYYIFYMQLKHLKITLKTAVCGEGYEEIKLLK